jgi:hypothetical protein
MILLDNTNKNDLCSEDQAVTELIIIIARVTIILFVAFYENDVSDPLLWVDLVSKSDLMLLSALLDSISVLVLSWWVLLRKVLLIRRI